MVTPKNGLGTGPGVSPMNQTLSPFGSVKTGHDNRTSDLERLKSQSIIDSGGDKKNLTIKLDSSKSRDLTTIERANLEE